MNFGAMFFPLKMENEEEEMDKKCCCHSRK